MGRVYLCLGKNAEVPYYFERSRTHIWNVEELCYFIRENAWLLEPDILGKELTDWISLQCGLPELAQKLAAATENNAGLLSNSKGVQPFVETLFSYTGYFDEQEAQQVERILRVNENTGELERTKARGDYFLDSKKYVLALKEYESLFPKLTGAKPELSGKVYHNCGVACAKLFLFERAADYFEKAWKLTKSEESARQFLAAKRFALGQEGYVDFLADYPDFYAESMKLEERMQKVEEGWRSSDGASFVLQVTEAARSGANHTCKKLVQERTEELCREYREFTVG